MTASWGYGEGSKERHLAYVHVDDGAGFDGWPIDLGELRWGGETYPTITRQTARLHQAAGASSFLALSIAFLMQHSVTKPQ
jgi:hypothetical protein